jgi:hypothetical protein
VQTLIRSVFFFSLMPRQSTAVRREIFKSVCPGNHSLSLYKIVRDVLPHCPRNDGHSLLLMIRTIQRLLHKLDSHEAQVLRLFIENKQSFADITRLVKRHFASTIHQHLIPGFQTHSSYVKHGCESFGECALVVCLSPNDKPTSYLFQRSRDGCKHYHVGCYHKIIYPSYLALLDCEEDPDEFNFTNPKLYICCIATVKNPCCLCTSASVVDRFYIYLPSVLSTQLHVLCHNCYVRRSPIDTCKRCDNVSSTKSG